MELGGEARLLGRLGCFQHAGKLLPQGLPSLPCPAAAQRHAGLAPQEALWVVGGKATWVSVMHSGGCALRKCRPRHGGHRASSLCVPTGHQLGVLQSRDSVLIYKLDPLMLTSRITLAAFPHRATLKKQLLYHDMNAYASGTSGWEENGTSQFLKWGKHRIKGYFANYFSCPALW